MKPKIIVLESNNNLTLPVVENVINQHFDYEPCDLTKTYDKQGTLFVVNWYQYQRNKEYIDKLILDGYYVLFENFQEAQPVNNGIQEFPKIKNILFGYGAYRGNQSDTIIESPLYFWFCESLSWSGRNADYKNVNRIYAPTKKFFMPMNIKKRERDMAYDLFQDEYHNAIYSYAGIGKQLVDDVPKDQYYWDRYLDINWYNNTYCSVVVETSMNFGDDSIFVTEKTMKPLALRHPFLTLGCSGTLALLKSAGFETYDNLFDESYDLNKSYEERLKTVHNQIKNITEFNYDALTVQKMEHNQNLFFNENAVKNGLYKEVLAPLLEKINA